MHYIGKAAYTKCLNAAQGGGKTSGRSFTAPPPVAKKDETPKPFRGAKVLDYGTTEDGIPWAIAKGPEEGVINGYFQVEKDHPWYGLDAMDVEELSLKLEGDHPIFHGGGDLTFGSKGWFGFDTLKVTDFWEDAEYPLAREITPDSELATIWTQELVAQDAQAWADLAARAAVSDMDVQQNLPDRGLMDFDEWDT